jgi:hypothetical protein
MKRKPSLVALKGLAAALAIIAASTVVDAQATVSVPFKFEAGGKSFPTCCLKCGCRVPMAWSCSLRAENTSTGRSQDG